MTQPADPVVPTVDGETSRHAITAMVFAVLGVLGLVLIGPVLALVFAAKARAHVVQEPGRPGRELAATARAVAIISLVLQVVVALIATVLAVVLALTARDAVRQVGRTTGSLVSPSGAGAAFTSLCTKGLGGDAGSCGCALTGVRAQGITDQQLALAVTEYGATGTVPAELVGPLQDCGLTVPDVQQ